MSRMDRDQPTPRAGPTRWVSLVTWVVLPAVIASAGFAAVFRLSLPRATDAILMAWSLVMTYVASRAMTRALQHAAAHVGTRTKVAAEDR